MSIINFFQREFIIWLIKAVYAVFLDHVWLRFAVLLIVVLFKHRYEVLSEEEAGEEVYEVPIIQVSWLSQSFIFCFVLFFANQHTKIFAA